MSTLLLDRRSFPATAGDPILLHAFARRGRPLSAGDLLRAMTGTGARPSEVMDLLTGALAAGLLERRGHRCDQAGVPAGPLLYALTGEGRAVVEADRLV